MPWKKYLVKATLDDGSVFTFLYEGKEPFDVYYGIKDRGGGHYKLHNQDRYVWFPVSKISSLVYEEHKE
jgi:hypothetical protein